MPTSCLWICYRVCDVCVALTHLVFRYDWRFSCREDLSKRSVLSYDIRAQTQVRMIFAIFQLHFYNLWYFGIITQKNKPTHWKVFTIWRKLQKWNWINQFSKKNAGFHHFPSLVCPKFVRGPRADRHLAPVHGDWWDLVLVPECDASWTTHRDCCYPRCQTRKRMEMVCTVKTLFITKQFIYSCNIIYLFVFSNSKGHRNKSEIRDDSRYQLKKVFKCKVVGNSKALLSLNRGICESSFMMA